MKDIKNVTFINIYMFFKIWKSLHWSTNILFAKLIKHMSQFTQSSFFLLNQRCYHVQILIRVGQNKPNCTKLWIIYTSTNKINYF